MKTIWQIDDKTQLRVGIQEFRGQQQIHIREFWLPPNVNPREEQGDGYRATKHGTYIPIQDKDVLDRLILELQEIRGSLG